jgi:transposase
MTTRKAYTTDLSDQEWQIIEPLLPGPKHLGRKIPYSRREILNAIFAYLGLGSSSEQSLDQRDQPGFVWVHGAVQGLNRLGFLR